MRTGNGSARPVVQSAIRVTVAAAAVTAVVATAGCEPLGEAKAGKQKHPITKKELLGKYAAGSRTIPDGGMKWIGNSRSVVYGAYKPAKGHPSGARDRHYIERSDTTSGKHSYVGEGTDPVPSPDGRSIAFTGKDGQLRVKRGQSKPTRITRDKGMVGGAKWSPDSKRLAYRLMVPPGGAGGGKSASKSPSGEIRTIDADAHNGKGARTLWKASPGKAIPGNIDWTPDGRKVVFGSVEGQSQAIRVVPATGGKPHRIMKQKGIDGEGTPLVSPDGKHVAFTEAATPAAFDQWNFLSVVPIHGGKVRRISGGKTLMLPETAHWAPDGKSLYASIATGSSLRKIGRLTLDGRWHPVRTERMRSVESGGGFDVSKDGKHLVFPSRGTDGSVQLRTVDTDGRHERTLRNLVPGTEKLKVGKAKDVSWESRDGLKLHGLLYMPRPEKRKKGKLPLVVQAKGGPTGTTPLDSGPLYMSPLNARLLNEQGYAVFVPNYRSDKVTGQKPWNKLVADHKLFSRDAADIESGVDHLIRKGVADRSKLALMGTSWGGLLTNWIAAGHNRYQAIVPAATHADHAVAFKKLGQPPAMRYVFGGTPEQKPEVYHENSPVDHLRPGGGAMLVTSLDRPTYGENKRWVRKLREVKKSPIKLVRYRNESHGIMHPDNQRDYLDRLLPFLKKHIGD